MKYICGTTKLNEKHTCVTLGKFDGLHLGHRLLLQKLNEFQRKGYRSIVFTFDYPPASLFSDRELALIYTEEEKRELIERLEPDVLISYPFSKKTASMEPEEFIRKVLMEQLDARIIIVGSDFRFGRNRRGDIEMLRRYEAYYGYRLIVIDKLFLDSVEVSSTRIRQKLQQGHLEEANRLLGEPYTIFGVVRHGRRLGRTLGMPTVNILPLEHKLLPPNGVYASQTVLQHKNYLGVTNIGFKPTVGAEAVRGVETYLFDFDAEVYGEPIEVQLYAFERPEMKFASLPELKAQVEQDILFARSYFQRKR